MNEYISMIETVCGLGRCAPELSAEDQTVNVVDRYGNVGGIDPNSVRDVYECATCGVSWDVIKRDGVVKSARKTPQ
jgi:hypothetical protein